MDLQHSVDMSPSQVGQRAAREHQVVSGEKLKSKPPSKTLLLLDALTEVTASAGRGIPELVSPVRQRRRGRPLTSVSTLSRRQAMAAGLLARGYSVGVVADCLNMPRRSVFRWKRMPAFVELLRACRALVTRRRPRATEHSVEDFAASVDRFSSPAFDALRRSLRFP